MKKNKRNSNSKYVELWYRFSENRVFQSKIQTARTRLRIPESGFLSAREFNVWEKSKMADRLEDVVYDLLFEIIGLETESIFHDEGDFLYTASEGYLLFGEELARDSVNRDNPHLYGCKVYDGEQIFSKHYSRLWTERLKNGVIISLKPYVTEDDIKYFFRKKWKSHIKPLLESKKKYQLPRIRRTTYKEIYSKIIYLNSKSRNELGLFKRGDGTKAMAIAKIIFNEDGRKISEERVRTIIKKYNKQSRGLL